MDVERSSAVLNVSKPMAYVILGISIVLEIIGSSCLEACDGFRNIKLTVILIICYLIAFCLFSKILHIINLAVGYATWTSVGAIATSFIGVFYFDQPLSPVGWISIFGMAAGVVLLNLFGTPKEDDTDRSADDAAGSGSADITADSNGGGN